MFAIERSVRQGCTQSSLLYVLTMEPLLHRLKDEGMNPALCGVPFAGPLTARVSTFTGDISVCILPPAYKGCEESGWRVRVDTGAKVSFDKSKGLQLGAWRGSDTIPGPFHWSGRLASNPSSLCYSTSVTSWTMFFLRFRMRSEWCFLRSSP